MWFTTSWDDGHPLDRRLAELLARHGVGATFYCPLRNAEGLPVMGAADMRALDGAFEIGSHTHDHAYADRMPLAAWRQQVHAGKAALEDHLGHAVAGFCYPGGRVVRGAREVVAEAGFRHARGGENLRWDCGTDPLLVPSTLQCFGHPRRVLLRNFLRRGHWARRWTLARVCLSEPALEQRLRAALAATLARGGVFHLWGHSWELERQGLWPLLDRFLAHVAARVPRAARLDNAGVLRARGLLT